MKQRKCLKGSIRLCGESDGARFSRTFRILKKVSEGASVICYEAEHDHSGRGILKEFYPQDACGVERDAYGQLVSSGFEESYARFQKAEKDYVQPYEMLLQVKRAGKEGDDIATFIPSFEIYHGCDENNEIVGTTYIWTPATEVETFDAVCDEIHKHPTDRPERKLVTVLSAIDTLTKCVRILHSAELLHRDIKPSNFGFVKRKDETLTQALTMFDINTVCSVYASDDMVVGTDGFLEPEAACWEMTNQTDIYAIGATLFSAVVVTDETKTGGYTYRAEYYDRLREMVDESKLIRASESNSHPRLRNTLTTIMKRCLCRRAQRYKNCEELLKDLEEALYYALPSELAKKHHSGERWVLADVEKSLDKNKEKNSFLSIQYYLYEHPLYRFCAENEENLNVLVVGFGNYGQKFLDACLQNGQMRGKNLRVTVVSDDKIDRDIYLSERPELADFFNVDGSLDGRQDAYGSICFKVANLGRDNRETMTKTLHDVMSKCGGDCPIHYVFVALGDDRLNEAAAKVCKEARFVGYVCEQKNGGKKETEHMVPLFINGDARKMSLYSDIERMAFNTHLVWLKTLNVDYGVLRAEYRKTYNHDSSVSGVLSLKYKLFGMGIDLDKMDFGEAARRFAEMTAGADGAAVKDELVWIEHRRWVTEKLCLGWRRIQHLEDCADGKTRDERNKRHCCILRSRPDRRLAEEFCQNGSHQKWDTATEEELSRLDDLDRMSVELHRMFVSKAQVAKTQAEKYTSELFHMVNPLVEDVHEMSYSFYQWRRCIQGICSGNRGMKRSYFESKVAFLKAIDALPEERKRFIHNQVKAFEARFSPILSAAEYRDWKQSDVEIIDNIPFILTYTEKANMVVPFTAGMTTSAFFSNVSAATVINPSRLIYLYLAENNEDVDRFTTCLPHAVDFIKKKRLKAVVDIVFLYRTDVEDFDETELTAAVRKWGQGILRRIHYMPLAPGQASFEELKAYLCRQSAHKPLFAVEKNDTAFSLQLQKSGFYDGFDSYQFDSDTMRFYNADRCEALSYVRNRVYLRVEDNNVFSPVLTRRESSITFFEEYEDLWREYVKHKEAWQALCEGLQQYAEEKDTIFFFETETKHETPPKKMVYLLPGYCYVGAKNVVEELKKQGSLEKESAVECYATNACRVILFDRLENEEIYDRIFANHFALMMDEVYPHTDTKTKAFCVSMNCLNVDGAEVPLEMSEEIRALLKSLAQKGYILNPTVTIDGRVRFTYATKQVKWLFASVKRILQVYVYQKSKLSGFFDDMAVGMFFEWDTHDKEDSKRNILGSYDFVFTKGFRTLFVKCMAGEALDEKTVFSLRHTATRGINAAAVLVIDKDTTAVDGESLLEEMVVLSGRETLEDIDRALSECMTGRVTREEK